MHTQKIHPYIHRKVVSADGPVDRREKTHRSRPARPPARPTLRSVGRSFIPDRVMAPIVLP